MTMPMVFQVGGLYPVSPTRKTLSLSSHARVGSVITVAAAGRASAGEACHVCPPSVEYSVASVKSYVWMLANFFEAATIWFGLFGLMAMLDSLRALLVLVSWVTWTFCMGSASALPGARGGSLQAEPP